MRINTMKMKIAFWAGLCLIITAITIISYSSFIMKKNAESARQQAIASARQYAAAVARQEANYIKAVLEVALDTARALAHALSSVVEKENNVRFDRHDVNAMLKTVLEKNPDFVGIGNGWEPNAFDGRDSDFIHLPGHDKTGRFIPYWSRDINGNILAAPLIDYEKEGAGDYYLIPRKTKKECIIEPYIYDVQGVPTLMTTLAVPILNKGKFYGMTGIDFRLDKLQEIADNTQYLYDNTGKMFIISHRGMIAAASGSPDSAGKSLQTIEDDYHQDMAVIQNGKQDIRIQDDLLKIVMPVHIGYTDTPWAVKINIPEYKITQAADIQMHNTNQDRWIMAFISLCCTFTALFFTNLYLRPVNQSFGS